MPPDITVKNISSASLTIQSQTIASQGTYNIPFGNISAWAHDPYFRVLLLTGQVSITVLGKLIPFASAYQFMSDVASGSVVFAS